MCKDPENCPAEFHCEECGKPDPEMNLADFGIGPYEFWGAKGCRHDLQWVSRCCEGNLVDCQGYPYIYEPPEGPEKEWEAER
jgi:hypothetical protein